jgi:hypothetical protein
MADKAECNVRCPNCGNVFHAVTTISPADTAVEGPPVHWLADSCKPTDPDMERQYTREKDEVTCLLCKIKCRCANKS